MSRDKKPAKTSKRFRKQLTEFKSVQEEHERQKRITELLETMRAQQIIGADTTATRAKLDNLLKFNVPR